ncbi:hypothetical protein BU15DRAFT_75453 [Melanogaster broomeanus]|nr:hypothetical protein BU15DRAFT_75453 [Melanogaster broomeanus]
MASDAGINLGTTWGSTLAGVFVSLVFYGVSILQTFIYYERDPEPFQMDDPNGFDAGLNCSILVLGTFYMVTAMFNTSIDLVSGPLLQTVANAMSGIAAAVDVSITIAMCTLLAMGLTGFEDTDRILLRLIFISVNTGLSSALFTLFVIALVGKPEQRLPPC